MLEEEISYAMRHAKYDPLLLEEVLSQDMVHVQSRTTLQSRQLFGLVSEVTGEFHKLKGFIRFELSPHKILYAKVTVKNEIEDLLATFFKERFPGFCIVIESSRGCFIAHYNSPKVMFIKEDMSIVLKKLESCLPRHDFLDDLEKSDQEIWKSFYDSQIIQQRKNIASFSRCITKKYQHLKGLDHERYAQHSSKRLTDFT